MPRTPAEAAAVEGTFYDEAAAWITELAERAAVIIDVGSGCGAAACALARVFPEAYVVVAHASRAALARARARSIAGRVAERVETWECAPGDGALEDEPADLVWARDLVPDDGVHWGLPEAARLVRPGGLLAWAEGERAMRVLDDDLGVDRPGLLGRLEAAARGDDVAATTTRLLADAGLLLVSSQTFLVDVPAPLCADARAHVVARLRWLRSVAGHRLDVEDARALDCLLDPADPRCVLRRDELFYRTSPRVQVAYRAG